MRPTTGSQVDRSSVIHLLGEDRSRTLCGVPTDEEWWDVPTDMAECRACIAKTEVTS